MSTALSMIYFLEYDDGLTVKLVQCMKKNSEWSKLFELSLVINAICLVIRIQSIIFILIPQIDATVNT